MVGEGQVCDHQRCDSLKLNEREQQDPPQHRPQGRRMGAGLGFAETWLNFAELGVERSAHWAGVKSWHQAAGLGCDQVHYQR
jgi:hypothetical protein